jgi:chloride channel protein, CIC family
MSDGLKDTSASESLQLGARVARFFVRINLTEQHFLLALAMLLGVSAGLVSVVFRAMLRLVSDALQLDGTGILGHAYLLPLIPATGGLVAGLIWRFHCPESKGAGVSEVINALITRRGVIRPRVILAKTVASVSTLATGGAAGSEGPIIQIGAACGSGLGQIFRFSEIGLKTLIACGAAAGISAIFNAPIAGVMFALEIILGDFTIAAFTPVVISSVLSAVVAHSFFGTSSVFSVPDYLFRSPSEMLWYIALAILCGLVGVVFIKALFGTEDLFERYLSWIPPWLRPALGGAVVGTIGLVRPEILGVGYGVIEAALHADVLPNLIVLMCLKLVATSFTIGSGGSGGVFGPSLFLGATLGGAFGHFAQTHLPGVASSPGAFAVVGMGAMVAATTHAPLTAMLIIFEMTESYHIILPLMFASIIAVVVARSLERESTYTLKLTRRGLRLYHGRDLSVLDKVPVSQIVSSDYEFVREHTSLGEIVDLISHSRVHDFPVLDGQGKFLGMVWFHDIREVMMEEDMAVLLIAEDVLGDQPPRLHPESTLSEALMHFSAADADTLPVFSQRDGDDMVGVITRSDLMRSYERELLLREREAARADESE